MSTEENKAQARRSWEIVNQRNPDLIEEFYPPTSSGTNPIETSRATSKQSSLSHRSLRPSPTSASASKM